MSIEIKIGIAIIIGFAIWGSWYIIKRTKENNNEHLFDFIPHLFPTLGILFTFLGIAIGLWNFDSNNIEKSIPELMNGLKTAFLVSIGGVFLLVVFSFWTNNKRKKLEEGVLSDEAQAIYKLIDAIKELRTDLNFIDDKNNVVKIGNIFRDLYEESKKQSNALQTFSTDLAITVSAGFEQILNNPNEGVVAELKLLKTEIENLGKKLQDPTTEMTQNVVKDLQNALGGMIDEFKISMSGSTKSELEHLTKLLSQAGGSLNDFPSKLQSMTDNLNENFKGLQEVVQMIAKQTLSQSEQSTEQMRKQVEEMSKILTDKAGDLQIGQEVLMTKQSENLQVSDKLLSAFNTSIEKMNGLSKEVTETISGFAKVQSDLSSASGQLKNISDNVNAASNNFREAQQRFSQQSNQFLEKNSETIAEIQKSLTRAKEVSNDYSLKFGVIEKGLQGIFNQIQTGLDEYKDTVGESLETFLGKYTDALTKTAESLAGATAKQEDILEELTEQLSKLNGRRN
jgi:ABC-type transporter Mla subunit MlaD